VPLCSPAVYARDMIALLALLIVGLLALLIVGLLALLVIGGVWVLGVLIFERRP
jgi:hypothetical protein